MENKALKRVRLLLIIFMTGLFFSGVTAFPLETELRMFANTISASEQSSGFAKWIFTVKEALVDMNTKYPFLAYGTDWLAFAHVILAILFIGPWRDPIKNIWVIEFGMIACMLVIPLALIAGGIRGIPFGWRLIDCSFGIFGIIPLWLCRRIIVRVPAKL